MIPILHYNNIDITSDVFNTNGIGRLSDCISCTCTEERNGIYEIEFSYPVTGVHFNQLRLGRIVAVIPSQGKGLQPFIIYRRTADLNGIATFNAYHYSYLLTYSIMAHATYSGISALFNAFETAPYTYGVGDRYFFFHTDKTGTDDFTIDGLASVKSLLFGMEGSVLDVYGSGEYDYDKNHVYLYKHRGANRNFTIRYGANMTKLVDTLDGSNLYNGVVAYWVNNETGYTKKSLIRYGNQAEPWTEENGTIITDESLNDIVFGDETDKVYILDCTDEFETQPNVNQLNRKAEAWLINNTPWIPKHNIDVDFVFLSQTEEYKSYKPLEDVRLCDTVNVIYPELGVAAKAKVVKTVWNVLLDRYDSIELGQTKDTYRGYNGFITISGKQYKVINGIIINL